MGLRLIIAALAGVALIGAAGAQQAPAIRTEQPVIEKPKAPAQPVAPTTRPSAPKETSGQGTAFASELQSMSAEAREFATSKLPAMTPALRVSAATRILGRAVALSAIPTTWIATAATPSTPNLWLGGTGVNLVTGPDVEAMFQVAAGAPGEHGVWVQFKAEAGMRYLLVCDMTGPGRWDLVADSRSRTRVTEERKSRGVALVAAQPASGYRRLLLTVARPLQTGLGSSVMDVLRRCEVTAIRA